MWKISGPPATVAHLGNYIQGYQHDIHIEDCICDQFPRGPHIAGHLGQMGVCQLAPKRPIFKYLNNFFTKFKFKGGQFHEKNCQLLFFRPKIVGHFDKKGSANLPNWSQFLSFSTISCKKSKLKGIRLIKKCQFMYMGSLNAGRFKQKGVSAEIPIHPEWTNFEFFSTISCTKPKYKEIIFYVKN